jgi:hypothetical protein
MNEWEMNGDTFVPMPQGERKYADIINFDIIRITHIYLWFTTRICV